MSVQQRTNVKVTIPTWRRLNAHKQQPGESFDDVINRLMEEE